MYNFTHLSEAWRIFKRSRYVKKNGIKKYEGNAKEICQQVVRDCWNGKYFQTSTGHFCEFYMRDFGFCIDSLLKLGYKKEVHKTLSYCLDIYSKQGLKTTITPNGKAIDIFMYSPDSLAYLIRSLRIAKANDLVEKYKEFLEEETNRCFTLCFDKTKSLIRSDRHFGSIKDESLRRSSTYDNIMIAMLSNDLDRLKLNNPFKKYDIKKAIKEHLWSGKYFYDDISKHNAVTGDSNVFPFWTDVFNDKKMLKSCINKIRKAGLDKPFPLKYSSVRFKEHKFNIVSKFVGGYEHDSIWMHMGLLYISLVKKVDKNLAEKYLNDYTFIIKKHKNFLEVFDKQGKPFKSPFYFADEGMIWAANYVKLYTNQKD